jgi:hypothetical protein
LNHLGFVWEHFLITVCGVGRADAVPPRKPPDHGSPRSWIDPLAEEADCAQYKWGAWSAQVFAQLAGDALACVANPRAREQLGQPMTL